MKSIPCPIYGAAVLRLHTCSLSLSWSKKSTIVRTDLLFELLTKIFLTKFVSSWNPFFTDESWAKVFVFWYVRVFCFLNRSHLTDSLFLTSFCLIVLPCIFILDFFVESSYRFVVFRNFRANYAKRFALIVWLVWPIVYVGSEYIIASIGYGYILCDNSKL